MLPLPPAASHTTRRWMPGGILVVLLLALPFTARAQSGDADLAQELTNPVADLVSVPVQMNFDRKVGLADEGTKLTTNVQPVIPFRLGEDWNLITRTIAPIVYQEEISPGSGSQFGLGDINASFFFSPVEPTAGGLLWGAGPVLLLPTGTDDLLSAKKWAAGPAGLVLTIRGPWTMGMLANHLWSFAGDNARQDVSNTFLQPFVAYTWPSAWTLAVQSESTYSWETENWSVPINVGLSKLTRLGKLPVSLQGSVGYWLESPDSGPEDVRLRLQVTCILPR